MGNGLRDPGIHWQRGATVHSSPPWQSRHSSCAASLEKSHLPARDPQPRNWKSLITRRFSKAARFTRGNANQKRTQKLPLFTSGSLLRRGTHCPYLWRLCTPFQQKDRKPKAWRGSKREELYLRVCLRHYTVFHEQVSMCLLKFLSIEEMVVSSGREILPAENFQRFNRRDGGMQINSWWRGLVR